MGAFCVFGVSRSVCRKSAEKSVSEMKIEGQKVVGLTIAEWGAAVRAVADEVFTSTEKRVRISPEFDAPQFCRDWIETSPGEVRDT